MDRPTIAQRLALLETEVARLRDELRVSKAQRTKDWRRTIGAFTDDEGMQQILAEAMKLRESDRRQARSKKSTQRKPSR